MEMERRCGQMRGESGDRGGVRVEGVTSKSKIMVAFDKRLRDLCGNVLSVSLSLPLLSSFIVYRFQCA